MTSFEQLILKHLEEAEIWIGTGYTRVVFRGLTVIAWWFDPLDIRIDEFEPDELGEPC